ncbi:MAG: D-alanyl-D-alanine carboxypeptidase/D-alanyl-D-alanine-endopeptidase [Chlorobi bacterium CHB2]|nr:D-alanyl-D-alanine carboxypeptidase/D-alanyl-D-alanine-endopeptidase [Chlorobi bacterium CHB2]
MTPAAGNSIANAAPLLRSFTLLAAMVIVNPATANAQHPPSTGTGRTEHRVVLARLARDLDGILADRNFADATWGVSVVSCQDGDQVYRFQDRRNRQMASNIKLLTTITALNKLGSSFRFSTEVIATGEVVNGDLQGDLVIRCSGDPSISPSFGINPQEVLQGWARTLDSLGIRSIRHIVVDASLFDTIPYAPGWAWDDETFGFNAPISGAAMYDNSIAVTVAPGKAAGKPVQIDVSPSTAYVTLRVTAQTTRSDSVATLEVHRDRGSAVIVVAGNIAAGAEPYTEHISIEQPPVFFATLVREELGRSGIEVRGGAYDANHAPLHDAPRTSRRIALYLSPELRQIAAATNKQSLNLSAEMLLKAMGERTFGVGSTASGIEVVKRQLSDVGIDVERLRLADGSGLSRQAMISTADMTRLLRWAYRKPALFRDVLSTLSVAGTDGTLATRMAGTAAEGNVFGKTGYMGGVRALSGYVRTRDGEWLAFSIAVNNYTVPTALVNKAHDQILTRLANFSRRG